jgi:hypothetical protein
MSILSNKYNISIWQGSTFGLTVRVNNANNTPQNITGKSARMQIRSSYDADTAEETLTTETGEITLTDSANGELHLELTATRTANIEVDLSSLATVRISETETVRIPRTNYVYDLELIDGSNVSKILYGDVIVYGEVTRNE